MTDKKQSIDPGNSNVLLGWNIPWIDYSNLDSNENPPVLGINTSVLPEREILFGEHTHSHVSMDEDQVCLLYTSPSPRDGFTSRMPSSA